MMEWCAEVITLGMFNQILSYSIPIEWRETITCGMLVEVPFGKMTVLGVVLHIGNKDLSTFEYTLKPIHGLKYDFPIFGQDLLDLILWISRYYDASYRSILEAMIPAIIRGNGHHKFSTFYKIKTVLSPADLAFLAQKFPKQHAIYQKLSQNTTPMLKSELEVISSSAIKTLLKKNILEEISQKTSRNSLDHDHSFKVKSSVQLTTEQQAAANHILSSFHAHVFQTHVLHGITGSGKTEVYLAVMREVIQQGRDIIYLVPELSLTPQTVARIRAGLGLPSEEVVVWHSGLSEGERFDAWMAMAQGTAHVVIGARSAIFAPFKSIGAIIVDEEHETTYKQNDYPYYHARDVAVYRAKLNQAIAILGSATPSVETLYNTTIDKYKIDHLRHRIDHSVLPTIEVVDMRDEVSGKYKKVLSRRLLDLLRDRLEKQEQSILFLNHRGFASTSFCEQCDYVATCPHCSTSLVYHKSGNFLKCHICGYTEPMPVYCPKCGASHLIQSGIGTQKLYSIIEHIFPEAKLLRMDSDTMTTKNSFYQSLQALAQKKVDILIGTQMITKGLDFPDITLVGIINIDNAMNFPDFRSNERAFRTIVQVAGRAGRGEKPGTVIIQTHCPHSSLLQMAVQNDISGFLQTELYSRREFGYPPFSHIIRIVISGKNDSATSTISSQYAHAILQATDGKLDIRGPAPAIIAKTNDRYRYTLMCFSNKVTATLALLHELASTIINPRKFLLSIDVDPNDSL